MYQKSDLSIKDMERNISNIVLVGFMGTGKTSVGVKLADALDMNFIDTDDLIEKNSHKSISDIFAHKGEEYFRNLESQVVDKVCKLKGYVIATGGGIVKREKNVEKLKTTGVIFCLSATPEIILQRTSDYNHRPLLQVEDPLSHIKKMLNEREPFYACADYKIDTSNISIDQVVEKIINILRCFFPLYKARNI